MHAMQKICPSCGKLLPENARFCEGCGGSVENVPVTPLSATPAAPTSAPFASTAAPSARKTPKFVHEINEDTIKWSKVISAILAVFLAITVIITIVRGTFYNAVTAVNFEKLYDEAIYEFGRYNQLEYILDDLTYGSNSSIDDGIDFLNSKKVKQPIQKGINAVFDMLLTGNPKKLLSEREVAKLVKSVADEIEDVLGMRLSGSDIDYIAESIVDEYFYSFYNASDREIRRMVDDFWKDISEEFFNLRPILHPVTKNVLIALDILFAAALVFLNLGQIKRLLTLLGIPALTGGAVALILALLTGVWASIIADKLDVSTDIVKIGLSGYTSTAVKTAVIFLIIGGAFVVLDKLRGQNKPGSFTAV